MNHHAFRPALTAGAAALVLAALSGPAAAKTTIDTYGSWDGEQLVLLFGCPNTTTYGQVITIPAGSTSLDKVTFSWRRIDNDGVMKVRAEVYAWDGSKATGASLYEKKRKISYPDFNWHEETFKTGGVPVTPGQQYVVFASIDKDYEKCTNNFTLAWGAVDDATYADGMFVYQNNAGDESQWTVTPWSLNGLDLAFKATLTP